MKKMLFTFFLLITSVTGVYSQSAYYDALKLRKLLDTNNHWIESGIASIANILANYCKKDDVRDKFFVNNPFIKDFAVNISGSFGSVSGPQNILKAFSSIDGLDVTNIADGLARFLIKRGKEELNAAFFSQMKKFLDNDKHEECKILFPATIDFLKNIDPYKYSEFLQSLREAFHKDLSNLIIHLNQVIDLPKYENLNSVERLAIRTANIVSELSQAENSFLPDSIINQLASLQEWSKINNNLGNSWKLLNIISQSIREANATKRRSWVRLSDLNQNLFDDSITFRIYIGLLYQQVKNNDIAFDINSKTIKVDSFLYKNKDTIYRISSLIENFSLLANDVDQTINDFKKKQKEQTLNNDDYYTYISKAINIIEYGFKVANIIDSGVANDKYIIIAKNANDLYKNIYTKNYNNAVINAYNILSSINKDPANKILPGILKYGNFMASVIKAESPGDVENAIEAAALPAGSASIKKNTPLNISLNAYIGGYYTNYTNDLDKIDGSNSNIGFTAPVGIAISTGLRNGIKGNYGALSAYFALFDVGAIAGYRLSNDSTELQQKVTLGDIFTPGGYLVYGLPGFIPLSLGVGGQYGSKLYKVGDDGTLSVSDKSRWRWNLFVAIDIPLLNFYTKSK